MKRSSLIIIGVSVLMLSGCTKEFQQNDIASYIKDNYGVESVKVSSQCEIWEDEEGYEDKIWKCKIPDTIGIVFYVVDDYGWGMESVSNYLWTNFDDAVAEYVYDEYDGWDNIDLIKHQNCGVDIVTYYGQFKDLYELRSLFDEYERFLITSSGVNYIYSYDTGVSFKFEFDNPIRNTVDYTVTDGDYRGTLSNDNELSYEEALNNYILTCIDYRFDDIWEFTEEEIHDAMKTCDHRIAISRSGDENGEWEIYDDLCASKYSYGISFGTLYEILVRENYPVEGDCNHYSFVGVDGSVYEISYDFNDYEYEDDDETHLGYYYIKNGTKEPMRAYFYNHFKEKAIYNMTGILLKTGKL